MGEKGAGKLSRETPPPREAHGGKLNDSEKKQTILKLHKQCGHASTANLKKLMQNAGIKDPEVYRDMTEIAEKCDVCARHKKTPPKPVVGMP